MSTKPSVVRAVESGCSPESCSFMSAVRTKAPNTSQGGGSFSLASAGQARRAPPTSSAVYTDGRRPVETDRLFRRRVDRKRVRHGFQTNVKSAPCDVQRLFRLKHNGEFDKIVATNMDQCACTGLGGNLYGIREGVADLAERDGVEWWGQIKCLRKWRTYAVFCIVRH